jgi:hypothetical protein
MSFTSVVLSFVLRSLSSRDYADDISVFSLAVAYQEKPGVRTHAQKKESILVDRVLFIKELNSEVVIEDSLGYLEGDFVLLGV